MRIPQIVSVDANPPQQSSDQNSQTQSLGYGLPLRSGLQAQQSKGIPQIVSAEPDSQPKDSQVANATKTFIKSAATGLTKSALNIAKLIDPTPSSKAAQALNLFPPLPSSVKTILPNSVIPSADEIAQNPVSNYLGNLTGQIPAYVLSDSALLKAVPYLGETVAMKFLPKLAERFIKGGTRAAIPSAMTADPGNRLEDGALGFGTGGALGSVAIPAAQTVINAFKPDLVGPVLKSSLDDANSQLETNKSNLAIANARALTSNPASTQVKLEAMKANIDALDQQVPNLPTEESIPNATEPNVPEKQQISAILPGESPDVVKAAVQSYADQTDKDLSDSNNVQANQLGVGQNFSSRLGTGIKTAITKIRNLFKRTDLK